MEEKVVALTGASSGIGLATAHILSRRGAHLALADINAERLGEARDAITKVAAFPAQKVTVAVVDVSKPEEVNSWIVRVVEEHGRLDCAANIAGIGEEPHSVVDVTDDEWDQIMGVNAKGVFNCLRAELKYMGSGASIVNVASVAGLIGGPGIPVYTASKHAVLGLTRSVAKGVGMQNIRVNAIAPGPIETPLLHELDDDKVKAVARATPLGRTAEAQEVGRVIAFLLSDEASYQTGQVIQVDGGLHC